MPRFPRLFLPHMPHHIVQRGHNRQPVFIEAKDYRYYLENMQEAKSKFDIRIYAYCLMTNHVHLIVEPGGNVESVSMLIRSLAARQTRYINRLEQRSGTLWEGRFKSSLIDTDAYLLACFRYIELNPVRAAIVDSPSRFRWSSYRGHAGMEVDPLLDEHAVYSELGRTAMEREKEYRTFVNRGIDQVELRVIREAVQRNQLTGSGQFRETIEERTGRRISDRPPGRPSQSTAASINKPDPF